MIATITFKLVIASLVPFALGVGALYFVWLAYRAARYGMNGDE